MTAAAQIQDTSISRLDDLIIAPDSSLYDEVLQRLKSEGIPYEMLASAIGSYAVDNETVAKSYASTPHRVAAFSYGVLLGMCIEKIVNGK
jgi:hypothetical protein